MKKFFRASGFVLFSIYTSLVFAETPPVMMADEVVVTAERVPQKLRDTIQHTTVITSQDIARSQAIDVPTLLRREAGVEITQTGGLGLQSSLFMRGTESDHTLVLIDGMRVGAADFGKTALDQIMLDQIDRIEIVRGNVSSLYGSEAIGGVIQIFTKKGAGAPAISGNVGIGSNHLHRISTSTGGASNGTRFNVGVAHVETDGFQVLRPEYVTVASDRGRGGYRNTTLNLDLSHQLTPNHELGLKAFQTKGDVDYAQVFAGSQNASDQTLSSYALYAKNQLSSSWLSNIVVGRGSDELISFTDGNATKKIKTDNDQFHWQNQLQLFDNGKLVFGYEYLLQKLTSSDVFVKDRRRANSLFAGLDNQFGNHQLQANVRNDRYSDFGSHTTGLLGYGYRVNPNWRVNASISTAFKAPTFNELYLPVFGNPNLKPEKAKSAELGVQYSYESHLAKLVFFKTKIDDLINFNALTFISVNVDKAEIKGVELSYSGTLFGMNLKASATLQQPIDENTQQLLLRRARRFASVAIDKTVGSWQFGADLVLRGPHDDIHVRNFNRLEVGGYGLLNLIANYRINKTLTLGIRAENVFDKDYSLVHGYNTQGRALFVNLIFR